MGLLEEGKAVLSLVLHHLVPMLSLDNAFSSEELRGWHASNLKKTGAFDVSGFVVEHKFDGLGVNILYENGRFVRAATRGDGVGWGRCY